MLAIGASFKLLLDTRSKAQRDKHSKGERRIRKISFFTTTQRKKGIEPSTSALARQRSTTELLALIEKGLSPEWPGGEEPPPGHSKGLNEPLANEGAVTLLASKAIKKIGKMDQ